MMYNILYTDNNKSIKTIIAGQIGTGTDLLFTIKDTNNDAVDLTGFTTYAKCYIGIEGSLVIDGEDLEVVSAEAGTYKYTIQSTDFITSSYNDIELVFADNATFASATKVITASNCKLIIKDSLIS